MCMDTISSAEFRKTYPKITQPVAVTALGRIIGHYVPVGTAIDDRFTASIRPGEPPERPLVAQAERDRILRHINKGG